MRWVKVSCSLPAAACLVQWCFPECRLVDRNHLHLLPPLTGLPVLVTQLDSITPYHSVRVFTWNLTLLLLLLAGIVMYPQLVQLSCSILHCLIRLVCWSCWPVLPQATACCFAAASGNTKRLLYAGVTAAAIAAAAAWTRDALAVCRQHLLKGLKSSSHITTNSLQHLMQHDCFTPGMTLLQQLQPCVRSLLQLLLRQWLLLWGGLM